MKDERLLDLGRFWVAFDFVLIDVVADDNVENQGQFYDGGVAKH